MVKKTLKEEQGREEFLEEDIPFYYHTFFTFFNKINREYRDIIACWEGPASLEWRRSIFPDYKRNRDESKNEEGYKTLLEAVKTLKKVLNNYPIKQLSVRGAEADDVIFTLAMALDGDHTIISTDGDFAQILNYKPNIIIYNPIRKTVAAPNKYILEEKAIIGDKSDNIGGLYRIGEKTFEKMMEDEALYNKVMNKDNNKAIFEEFMKIVDLRRIPEELKNNIIKANEETPFNVMDRESIEEFYFDNRLKELLMSW